MVASLAVCRPTILKLRRVENLAESVTGFYEVSKRTLDLEEVPKEKAVGENWTSRATLSHGTVKNNPTLE